MSALTACLRRAVAERVMYPANVAYDVGGTVLFLFIQAAIWRALYGARDILDGITLHQIITYIVVAQFAGILTDLRLGTRLEQLVRTGDLTLHLIRPRDFRLLSLYDNVGTVLYVMVTRGFLLVILAVAVFRIALPASGLHLALFLLFLAIAFAISYSLELLGATAAFWKADPRYSGWVLGSFFRVFSGGVVPLWFFPDWLRPIADALPFKLMRFVPSALYLGELPLHEVPGLLLQATLWCAAILALAAALWSRGLRRVTVYGG